MTVATLPAHAQAPNPLRQDASVIALIGLAHGVSHFSQLLLPPLFPWLKDAFGVGYAQLGLLMTVFFVVSCVVQAAAGFWVDKYGPRPVLFVGLGLLAAGAFGMASSSHYAMLMVFVAVAGVGNGVFHPVDYTLLNRKVSPPRLGHAYSVHGISGSLGWALAPALMAGVAFAASWRWALVCAGGVAAVVGLVVWWRRDLLALPPSLPPATGRASTAPAVEASGFGFLRLSAVWWCFGFFFFYAMSLGVVQAFAPAAAQQMHNVPMGWIALCVTAYMVASATGMVGGGFLASQPERSGRVVAVGFGSAALAALGVAVLPLPAWAVPAAFAVMGLCAGLAAPSRDMLVKRATPVAASGRVYGVVYAGLDIGQAVAPLIFGVLMDQGHHQSVWLGLVMVQAVLIASAFQVQRAQRVGS
jgi:MFS transporter, FSR family, fosmidomycin resistance protein